VHGAAEKLLDSFEIGQFVDDTRRDEQASARGEICTDADDKALAVSMDASDSCVHPSNAVVSPQLLARALK
jgi:hypothetical protein